MSGDVVTFKCEQLLLNINGTIDTFLRSGSTFCSTLRISELVPAGFKFHLNLIMLVTWGK
jgi:hypothetical protein